MSAPPAFQFYPGDFDQSTKFLSAAATGAHIRMMCASWEHGPIVDSPVALEKAMGLAKSDPPFDQLWSELRSRWTLTKKGWIHRRLEKTRRDQAEYRENRRKAGEKGAQGRWQSHGTAIGNRMPEPMANGMTEQSQNGWQNDGPPISDLRSSSPSSSLSVSPAATNPHARGTNLVNGSELRTHGQHAWCSWPARDGLCVPAFLHRELVGKLGRASADQELREWYPVVVERVKAVAVGEDTPTFWRNQFGAWIGSATSKPSTVSTKATRTMDAARRVLSSQRQIGEAS